MVEYQRNLCRFSYLANANFKLSKMKPVLDYGSGDNDLDSGLDILLQDQKVIEMEKPKPKHAKSQGLV